MKPLRAVARFALAAVFLAALFADLFAPAPYDFQFRDQLSAAPSGSHPLGTDELGRDRMSRLLYGTRVSLLLAPAAAAIAALLAGIAGLFAAWFGLCYGGAAALAQYIPWRAFVELPVDVKFPYWPGAALLYLTILPMMLLAPFVLRDLASLLPLFAAFMLETAVAGVFFLLLPINDAPVTCGAATLACGIFMLARPMVGLISLTLVLAIYFVVEGIAEAIGAFKLKPVSGRGWMLASGIMSLILGICIWIGWPVSGVWAIGLLIGIKLLFAGATIAGIGFAARSATSPSRSGERSSQGAARRTRTRACIRTSKASCAVRSAIAVVGLPKKSSKSLRSSGAGVTSSRAASTACTPGSPRGSTRTRWRASATECW